MIIPPPRLKVRCSVHARHQFLMHAPPTASPAPPLSSGRLRPSRVPRMVRHTATTAFLFQDAVKGGATAPMAADVERMRARPHCSTFHESSLSLSSATMWQVSEEVVQQRERPCYKSSVASPRWSGGRQPHREPKAAVLHGSLESSIFQSPFRQGKVRRNSELTTSLREAYHEDPYHSAWEPQEIYQRSQWRGTESPASSPVSTTEIKRRSGVEIDRVELNRPGKVAPAYSFASHTPLQTVSGAVAGISETYLSAPWSVNAPTHPQSILRHLAGVDFTVEDFMREEHHRDGAVVKGHDRERRAAGMRQYTDNCREPLAPSEAVSTCHERTTQLKMPQHCNIVSPNHADVPCDGAPLSEISNHLCSLSFLEYMSMRAPPLHEIVSAKVVEGRGTGRGGNTKSTLVACTDKKLSPSSSSPPSKVRRSVKNGCDPQQGLFLSPASLLSLIGDEETARERIVVRCAALLRLLLREMQRHQSLILFSAAAAGQQTSQVHACISENASVVVPAGIVRVTSKDNHPSTPMASLRSPPSQRGNTTDLKDQTSVSDSKDADRQYRGQFSGDCSSARSQQLPTGPSCTNGHATVMPVPPPLPHRGPLRNGTAKALDGLFQRDGDVEVSNVTLADSILSPCTSEELRDHISEGAVAEPSATNPSLPSPEVLVTPSHCSSPLSPFPVEPLQPPLAALPSCPTPLNRSPSSVLPPSPLCHGIQKIHEAVEAAEEDERLLLTGDCPPPSVFRRWANRFLTSATPPRHTYFTPAGEAGDDSASEVQSTVQRECSRRHRSKLEKYYVMEERHPSRGGAAAALVEDVETASSLGKGANPPNCDAPDPLILTTLSSVSLLSCTVSHSSSSTHSDLMAATRAEVGPPTLQHYNASTTAAPASGPSSSVPPLWHWQRSARPSLSPSLEPLDVQPLSTSAVVPGDHRDGETADPESFPLVWPDEDSYVPPAGSERAEWWAITDLFISELLLLIETGETVPVS